MYYDIKEAKHIDRYKLEITFADGKQGIVDLEDYIKMPEISRFFGIIISIFYDDHNPPHFHARYGDYDAL